MLPIIFLPKINAADAFRYLNGHYCLLIHVYKWQIEKVHKFLAANGSSYLMLFYQQPEPDKDGGKFHKLSANAAGN